MSHNKQRTSPKRSHSWDDVATWYDSWVGKKGSHYHRNIAIPTVMNLLKPARHEHILDVGCGTGVLAPHVLKTGARYSGIDLSPKLVRLAQRYHPKAQFYKRDALELSGLESTSNLFDTAVFMLSIQDIHPLQGALESVSHVLDASSCSWFIPASVYRGKAVGAGTVNAGSLTAASTAICSLPAFQ